MTYRHFFFTLIGLFFLLLPAYTKALTLSDQDKSLLLQDRCEKSVDLILQEETELYRDAQYGPSPRSVLNTISADTRDLVPYLMLNYQALSCRLRLTCNAITGTGDILSFRPIGCSRLFAARGRWWSADRRNETFRTAPIPDCHGPGTNDVLLFNDLLDVRASCEVNQKKILEEERQMLRLLVMQDAEERGSRKILSVLQIVLKDVRESFLLPLRSFTELVGSVLHPIPCLLKQCD